MNADRFPAVVAAAAQGRILVDNAAGAQLPDLALERMQRYLAHDNAQRGAIFARPHATTELIGEAKQEFATLVGAPVAQVGVGLNGTSLAFAFSRLLAATVQRGDRIIVTAADHEANVAPWMWLRRFGVQVHVVPVDAHGGLEFEKYLAFLERNPVLVALPWASNSTGIVFDVPRLADAAKAAGALVVVDGVQALPHFPIELPPTVDFAFFSAYKMYAPHFGFWYASRRVLERYVQSHDAHVVGGDGRHWTLETGTQNHEGLAGWLGTLAYMRDIDKQPRRALAKIARYEAALSAYARQRFAERGDRVQLYGRPASEERLPVFAFNVRGLASDELAQRFEDANIEARVGDYHSPRLMAMLAGGAGGRAVRISLAHYNTTDDLDRCFEVIDGALERSDASVGAEAGSTRA